jgi:hypothetical protein
MGSDSLSRTWIEIEPHFAIVGQEKHMRSVRLASLLCFGFLFTTINAQQTTDKPWFDLENCAFCKNMSSQPGLMENMQCDTIKIENGMLMISIIPEEFKEAMAKANKGMEATVRQLESGKQLPLCGFCECFGNLMMRGTKLEKKQGEHSEVTMLTSNDPEIVQQIHAMADRVHQEQIALTETIRQKKEGKIGVK